VDGGRAGKAGREASSADWISSALPTALSRYDAVPQYVLDEAKRSFQRRWRDQAIAETVHDSRLDGEADDALPVQIVADGPGLHVELQVLLGDSTCVVLGQVGPSWSDVTVRGMQGEELELEVDGTGRFFSDRVPRGLLRFWFHRLHHGGGGEGGVYTEWLNL